MVLVYITNASMSLIVKSLRNKNKFTRDYIVSNIFDDLREDKIFTQSDLNDIFNTHELQDIYNMKMLLKDFQNLLESISGNKDIVTQYVNSENLKYAFTVKAPAYHKMSSCEWMKKNFYNIEIPKNCLSVEKNEIKVREWIKKNEQLLFDELNAKFIKDFECPEGLKKIDLKNSGATTQDNYIVGLYQERAKKNRLQLRFLLDSELGSKISRYKFAPIYKVENIVKYEKDASLHNPIIDFHSAKTEMKEILLDFYKNKYNTDLSFEKSILDSIGFNKCRACSRTIIEL